jgi:hypothetical protein
MSGHPYLEHMPALMLGDYHGRVVSPDGRQIFSVCGHGRADQVLYVVPYINGQSLHAMPRPTRRHRDSVRLPLHFAEGLEYAARVVARSGGATGYTAQPQPALVDIAKALAELLR